MSDTVTSQFDAKNQDDVLKSIIGERRGWGMSSSGGGQMPGGGGAGGGYPTHHLPPTVPNPTPTSSQRLRLPPTAPPPHQIMPPWIHSQATGLGSLPSSRHTYFGSPHLTAGRPAWPTGATAKPAGAHLGAANPLFSLQSLQMMVTATADPPLYQQETMDLSKARQNGNLPNGETGDSVSVIAQNPLRDLTPPEPDKIPNSDKAPPLPSPASPEPAASAPPVPLQPGVGVVVGVPVLPEHKPPTKPDIAAAAHTPDNVESILENMFRIQEDKQLTPPPPTSVTPHSVIVPPPTTPHNSASTSLSKDLAPVCSPPENINEQKLIEILKVEDTDQSVEESKEETKPVDEVKKKEADVVSETNVEDSTKTDSSSSSVKNEPVSIACEADEAAKPAEAASSSVEEVVISDSEDEGNATKDSTSSPVVKTEKVKDEPDSMFTEVESELEKMFAGIVEPGSEGDLLAVKEETGEGEGEKKPETKPDKRRGRPKGALSRRSSDTSFSGVESSAKKRKGKESVDKKGAKKVRVEVGSDAKKGRGTGSLSAADVGKSRGPVVHVEGSRDNPTSVMVVNGGSRALDDDDAGDATKASYRTKRTAIFQTEAKTRGQGAGLYSSTLSLRYDSQTADSTWLCVLCKRGPHCEPCVGDLFGPYLITLPPAVAAATPPNDAPCDYELSAEQKRRAGGKVAAASLRATGGADQFVHKTAKKKRTASLDGMMGGVVPVAGGGGECEVWVHEACAVWAPGVYMIGARLIGLQDAVAAAIKTRCNLCGEPGASIGCVTRGCRQLLHVACARRSNWHLDQHTFISKCSQHANFLQAHSANANTEFGRR
ncbi:uncharacterized protein CG5098 [Nilaparvata lugens]|uniref:uncharacterized protein CG5098 n=1 Tax=Nilaparvata lugens TaxID=108931 RepID=UPI00193E1A1D|nr:uncharacterized protein CG5098 [Nilaparvata lugens]